MKKIGRPESDNPKTHIIGCRLTDSELSELEEYCIQNKITKSKVIKKCIDEKIHNGGVLWE